MSLTAERSSQSLFYNDNNGNSLWAFFCSALHALMLLPQPFRGEIFYSPVTRYFMGVSFIRHDTDCAGAEFIQNSRYDVTMSAYSPSDWDEICYSSVMNYWVLRIRKNITYILLLLGRICLNRQRLRRRRFHADTGFDGEVFHLPCSHDGNFVPGRTTTMTCPYLATLICSLHSWLL